MNKEYISTSEKQDLEEQENLTRREYLISLKKWSKVVIGGVLLGGILTHTTKEDASAGSWANRRGGRGSAWANGGRAWANRRGGSWVNR